MRLRTFIFTMLFLEHQAVAYLVLSTRAVLSYLALPLNQMILIALENLLVIFVEFAFLLRDVCPDSCRESSF